MRVPFILGLLLVFALALTGCSGLQKIRKNYAPINWIERPGDLVRSVAASSSFEATATITAKFPTMQPGIVKIESDGNFTLITVYPPWDREELARTIREERQKHPTATVLVDTLAVTPHDEGVRQ